jgi:hypothetical protein
MSSQSIDVLALNLNADAKIAVDGIDKLAQKMGVLANGIRSVNGSNLSKTSSDLRTFSTAMQSLSVVKMPDYTRIANGIGKIGQIDSRSIGKAAGAINSIGNSLLNFSGANIGSASKQIAELANGIAKLGYKSSTKAIENIPLLAKAMRGLMTELSKAPSVSQNIIQMTNALGNLARTGASSGKAANSLVTSLNGYSMASSGATKKNFSLARSLGKLYAGYWLVFRALSKVKSAVNYAADLTEVQNVVDHSFGEMTGKVNEYAKESIKSLGMSALGFKTYASQYQAMGNAMGISNSQISKANDFLSQTTNGYIKASDKLGDVSLNMTKLAGDMASFYNKDQAEVADDLRAVYTGMVIPLRKYGLDLTQATLKEWAMKQGLDANIDSMSQAEKTMLRYQYVMANTQTVHNDFIRTQDTWANQIRILAENFKNLGATIGTPIINAAKPVVAAINIMIEHVNAFAQVVSEALGTIFGWKYEMGQGGITTDFENAEDASSGIASNTGAAANNAKKLKSYLMGIDELNVREENTGSPGGSGSGGGAGGGVSGGGAADNIGKWVEVEKKYDSSINTLEKLGVAISKALSDAMESINWNKIYEKASNFGTGLASFLNGMFAGSQGLRLFADMGTTLSSTLNTVVYAALNFASTLKWDEIGRNIAGGITAAFENWDAASTAQAINKWVQGVFDLIINAITNIDWMSVYDKITEFLENIDIKTIALVIGTVTLKKIGNVVAKVGLAEFIGKSISKIAKQVPIIIESLKIIASGGVIDESGILSKIANVISMIAGGAVKLTEWNEVNELLTITFGKLATNLTGVGTVIGGVTMLGINFFSMWRDGFSWLKEALLVAGSGIIALGAIILGATAPVALLVAGAVAGVSTIAVLVHDNWDKITEATSNLIENVKSFFAPLVDFIKNNVIEPITRRFNQFKDGISIIFQALEKIIKGVWSAVSTAVYNTFIKPAVDKFNAFKAASSEIFNAIKMAIYNAYDGSIVQRFVNTVKETLQGLGNFISTWASIIGGGITSLFKVIVNSIIWLFEKGINSPIDAVNTFLKGFNNIVSVAAKITGNKWGGVDLIPKVSLPRFENGGYPEVGDLFFANERGIPELVGTMNGKPAVGSGQEITGISNAVYSTSQAEIEELRQMNGYLRQLLSKDFSTHIGDRDIARANRRGEKQLGMQIIY